MAKPPPTYRCESFEEVGSVATYFFLIFKIIPFTALWKSCENHSTHSLYQHSILLMNFYLVQFAGTLVKMPLAMGSWIYFPRLSLWQLCEQFFGCVSTTKFFFIILANRYINPAREQPTVVSFSFSGNNQTWKITILSLLPNLWYWQGRV